MSPEVATSIRNAVECDLCKAPRGRRCRNRHGMPMTHVHQVRVIADLFKTRSSSSTHFGSTDRNEGATA